MEQRKLVQSMRELGRRMLGATLEPLDALLRALRKSELSVEFGDTESVHRAGVERGAGFAVECESLGRLASAPPAVLTACSGTVGGIGVAVLGGEDEEWVRAVKVLFVLDGADAIGVAVC